MTRIAVPALLALAVVAVVCAWPAAAEEKEPAIIVDMTSGAEDLHAVWMGLALADHALADGRRAVVYLNVHAVPLGTKKADPELRFDDKPPVRKHLESLMEKGARVIVCPGCSKVHGVTAEDLLPGVTFADREKLFGPIVPNSVVFSY
jgi:predicted peroxiredoxin